MKLLQQHRIGKLNAADMEKLKEEEKTSGGGGSALPATHFFSPAARRFW